MNFLPITFFFHQKSAVQTMATVNFKSSQKHSSVLFGFQKIQGIEIYEIPTVHDSNDFQIWHHSINT